MQNFGDITKINGSEVPIVDIVTGGSPCQDLSIAKENREGLSGERSGLFMEQIRVIKEMRNECARQLRVRGANDDIRLLKPRYMVFENVPGAFSSNKGEDFRCVLEETARIVEKDAIIPRPKKWENAGCIVGNGWSIAYRVHDAQYWGVPQRRKRICMVADFNGESAGKILFELRREANRSERNVFIRDIGRKSGSEIYSKYNMLSWNTETSGEIGRGNAGDIKGSDETSILTLSIGNGQVHDAVSPSIEVSKTLNCMDDPMKIAIFNVVGNQIINSMLRKLSLTEEERLQGYPDGWTDIGDWVDSQGKKHRSVDSHRYQALGNSIALPFWQWLADRMVNKLKEDGVDNPAMASLFDGIGGFPLVYKRAGCNPIWASEVEKFCVAVTKKHFGED